MKSRSSVPWILCHKVMWELIMRSSFITIYNYHSELWQTHICPLFHPLLFYLFSTVSWMMLLQRLRWCVNFSRFIVARRIYWESTRLSTLFYLYDKSREIWYTNECSASLLSRMNFFEILSGIKWLIKTSSLRRFFLINLQLFLFTIDRFITRNYSNICIYLPKNV